MAKEKQERTPQILATQEHGPAVVINRRASDRLRAGHLWVYRSDVTALVPPQGAEEPAAGSLVTVADGRGIPLGSGLYSSASQIAVRMVSTEPQLGREAYLRDVHSRIKAALALRKEIAPESATNNSHRLIFAEADGLPGIIVDRYNDLVIVQLLTQGTAQADLRAVLGETLREDLGAAVKMIVERPDPKIRELEELALPPAEPLYGGTAAEPVTIFTMNGMRFHYDASAGQKTGAFLDQRVNYAAAAEHAHGVALDVCTYQGGFALHLARNCERVTGVDVSRAALEVADRNLALNSGLHATVDWIEADAFELLREYDATGQRFDTIVLDPPAFAKSKRAVDGALRGYKEMNLRAMKMLQSGGTLVTCSCSHHVGREEFLGVVAAAASDARRRVQVLEVRGAAPDHPEIVTLPETAYLKCIICRVS
ncbi:class I SAM-dependent rRNA methyltransferase [Edaphobacter albus]|uniref:class I SAM-dependent rRNA methyltransferase n=1 Tax=Edaphobacter sp. 4G125 TaxID=2763071 RepID=UPI00164775A2|nr:class I SAM-dependent rRNA methyltransferase [Edaphobacter sp. 4G125]QNI37130.1 class I SAM-dependent rRNA methyltransferase [Edaphobacter sp. 4G125]